MAPAMPRALAPLPIDPVLPELAEALGRHPNAVLRAPTGAGKTTCVPPGLLAAGVAGLSAGQTIVMTEPRRVAARAAARRIAEEQGWTLGREVGYQVRFEKKATRETRILVVTEGILVQRLQADPFLDGVGLVIFDEIHERTVPGDLALAMARRVQREVRPDLRLLAMSATLDPGPLAEFLGGAPTIDSPGRLFPIEIRHVEGTDLKTEPREIAARVAAAVERALAEAPRGGASTDSIGGVLAFLPGVGEIRRAAEILESSAAARGCAILPLYGELPPEAQDAAIAPGPRRKIVLATNVAETSVTVSGVSAVVDSGLARILRYDSGLGLDRLELARIGRASAAQRSGRAGREGPGIAYRLWPEREHAARPERERPEIQRVDLAGPALELLAWGETDLSAFGWFEPPDPAALDRGLDLLRRLGALDSREKGGLSPLGRAMAEIPVHPRLARLLIEGRSRGVGREAALVAALLAERDPFRRTQPFAGPGRRTASHASRSDLLDRLDALEAFARSGGRQTASAAGELAPVAARSVLQAAEQLERSAADGPAGRAPAERDDALLAAVAAAYPDRIARRREPGSPRAVMVGGRGVRLGEESAVSLAELFACVEVDGGGAGPAGEARVRLASAVEIGDLAAERLREEVEVAFDAERERVVARRLLRFDDLVLSEREVPPPAEEASRVLADAAGRDLSRALALSEPEITGFLARWRWLRRVAPDLDLPPAGDEEIRALLPEIAKGRRSFADLQKAPLRDLLSGALSYAQAQALAREAPERIEVPSGSQIRLEYPAEGDGPPVLAVRIQELFGLDRTPQVAAGRVSVLLHLLAPNYRPQQVTRDLASFWANTYPQVKKELQGRYPKHAWPDDPRQAAPERRPRRRS